ncbi:hypothetical protein STEPF1_01640 [Streptomyces sp. F-1]|nr:hypothetical protein STEPF1_01640 [Streptomyces sp. F-1]
MQSVRSLTPLRKASVVAAAAAVAVAVTGFTGEAEGGEPPQRPLRASVTGAAEFRLPYLNDHDVRSFILNAHAAPYSRPFPGVSSGLPTDAYGTVKVVHYSAERHTTYTAVGEVDCLVTAPGNATLTAVFTKVSRGGPDWVGKRLGISVQDPGEDHRGKTSGDRVGFSWDDTVDWATRTHEHADGGNTCMAPAPFAPVTKGGYRVVHADLPLWPKP